MPPEPHDRLLSVSPTGMAFQYVGFGVVVCVMLIVGVLAWIPGVLDRVIDSPPWWIKTLPAWAIILGVFGRTYLGTLCTVYLTPHGLRIIRGQTEILVPMDQVKKVDRWRGASDRYDGSDDTTITITFRARTTFGTSIKFLASHMGDVSPQALVEELRRRAGFLPAGESLGRSGAIPLQLSWRRASYFARCDCSRRNCSRI